MRNHASRLFVLTRGPGSGKGRNLDSTSEQVPVRGSAVAPCGGGFRYAAAERTARARSPRPCSTEFELAPVLRAALWQTHVLGWGRVETEVPDETGQPTGCRVFDLDRRMRHALT